MKRITKIIYIYEDGSTSHVDIQNPLNTPIPASPTWYGNCPSCGLKLDQVMGYVCSNPSCPTGLGGTRC